MPTNHKQFLSSRWRFDVSLAKLSRTYVETSSRISSKGQECASRVVGDICRILCSTINRSVCTLYWNKNINTFWINGAFYYNMKSCVLVGTPLIILKIKGRTTEVQFLERATIYFLTTVSRLTLGPHSDTCNSMGSASYSSGSKAAGARIWKLTSI